MRGAPGRHNDLRGRGRGRGGRGGRGGNSSEQGILLAPSPAGRSQARGAGIRCPPRGGDGPTPADCDFQYVRVSDGIVGTCSDVERRYVRVQSQPDPASVRPAAVLAEALQAVARREAAGEPYETTSANRIFNTNFITICICNIHKKFNGIISIFVSLDSFISIFFNIKPSISSYC